LDNAALQDTVKELVDRIDQLYGVYLDATLGFDSNVTAVEEAQAASGATDDAAFFIGLGAPTDPSNVLLHQTTQGGVQEAQFA